MPPARHVHSTRFPGDQAPACIDDSRGRLDDESVAVRRLTSGEDSESAEAPSRGEREMQHIRTARRLMAYAWAAPTTCVGLAAGALTLATGGRAQVRRGAIEFHGGFSRWFAENRGFAAMTLGHAIIGRDPGCLESCRDHEQAHVRQVERWGPFFLPAYLLASAWAWRRGEHYYLDNWFERDARRACGETW